MKTLFLFALFICTIAGPARADTGRPLVIFDVAIPLPVPEGYVDASETKRLPANNALFLTEAIEQWEAAGEISEGIIFYGLGLKPSTEVIKQQKFKDIVRLFRMKIESQIAGESFVMPRTMIDPDLIHSIYKMSYGNNARSIELTDDREDRQALLIDTGFVMPGVVTYPILEEISFTRVSDRIVIFHAIRVDTGKTEANRSINDDIRTQLKTTGAAVRDGLVGPGQ